MGASARLHARCYEYEILISYQMGELNADVSRMEMGACSTYRNQIDWRAVSPRQHCEFLDAVARVCCVC